MTQAAINTVLRRPLRKHRCATKVPSAIIAIRNFTPEQASATSNRPTGVSMKKPLSAAGTPLACVNATAIWAVIVCRGGTISSPNGTRKSM